MEPKDKIHKAWEERCKVLPPCHNPDRILHVIMFGVLSDLQIEGEIETFEMETRIFGGVITLSVCIVVNRISMQHDFVYMGIQQLSRRPPHPDERFNFDE